jgi:molybdenum cofactor guanylyltransferase
MSKNNHQFFFVLACDLPNFQKTLLQQLLSVIEGYDAAIPRSQNGLAHPLCAVYRKTYLPFIEKALQQGANSVINTILDTPLRIRWLDTVEGRFLDTDLANLNTPEDLQRLRPGKAPKHPTPNM